MIDPDKSWLYRAYDNPMREGAEADPVDGRILDVVLPEFKDCGNLSRELSNRMIYPRIQTNFQIMEKEGPTYMT